MDCQFSDVHGIYSVFHNLLRGEGDAHKYLATMKSYDFTVLIKVKISLLSVLQPWLILPQLTPCQVLVSVSTPWTTLVTRMRSVTSLPTPTGEWAPVAVKRGTTAMVPTPVWPRTVQVTENYHLPLKSDVTFHSNFLSSIYSKLN